jgi:DNA-binding NtrC family response regulator
MMTMDKFSSELSATDARPGAEEFAPAPSRADFAQLNLIGESPLFLETLALIRRISASDATVLILGETGTGKELAARAIHYLGARRDAPFVPINCGAIPEGLVESELFGHARGAFTDARETRPGVIAQAEGGTLFLDEIESTSPRTQIALLRFLQDHEYRPVGGCPRGADLRIIAASNADLKTLATQGAFRSDFLFRLNLLSLELPPLRVRGDDVMLLAETFLRRFSARYRKPPRRLDAAAVAYLRSHTWPGNVRELENLIHREILLDANLLTQAADTRPAAAARPGPAPSAAPTPLTGKSFREARAQAVAAFERAYLSELLMRASGNVSLAARLCGTERSRLGKLMKKHGLDRSLFLPPRPNDS